MTKILCAILMLLTSTSQASLGRGGDDFSSVPTSASPASFSLWSNHSDWDTTALAVIHTRKIDLESAADLNTFCPGYKSASGSQQEGCLLRLVSALVKKESDFNAKAYYPEDQGLPSVGLMMLSRGECKNAPTEAELKIATKNLTCGINKLADYVKKGKCFSCRAGGGKYWSVLRAPYTYTTRSGQVLRLGKRDEIAALTSNYRQFAPTQNSPDTIAVASTETSGNAEASTTESLNTDTSSNGELWNWDWHPGGR